MPKSKSKKQAQRPWQAAAKEAHDHRDWSISFVSPSIPQIPEHLPNNVLTIISNLLPDAETRLTSLPITELLSELASRNVSAVDVSLTFLRRSGVAQGLTNCITELLPRRALTRARYLDEYLQTHGKVIGPLHGLPISVKEHIGMAGLHLSAAYVTLWDGPMPNEDALVLQLLARAGAVFHARTTEPQTMMQLETISNLYGTTTNPFNTSCSSGGSSGGESALIACGGSVLGIGTDVGGSIRIPAASCGLYGFKPTAFRVPTKGWSSTPPGADPITTVVGPLSRDLEGIEMFMRIVITGSPWAVEPSIVPMRWGEVNIKTPLRVGIMWHDGVVLPHPPVTRALSAMREGLERTKDVLVTDFKPYKHDEAWAITSSLYFTDGGESDASLIEKSGEPWTPLAHWMIKENPCVKKLTREELEYWLEEREEFRLEYAKHWNDTGTWNEETGEYDGVLDILIMPTAPWTASRHGTAKYWSYTSLWNLLDYPALVVPVKDFGAHGFVDGDVDVNLERGEWMSDVDEEIWSMFDPVFYHGMPIGLQLVARRFEDEKLLGIARFLRDELRL